MNRSINRNPSTARRTGLLAHLAVPRAIYWGIQSPGFVGFQCGRVEGAVQNFARSGCHGSWRGGAALSLFASQGKRLRALSVRQGCGDVVGRNTVLPGQVNVAVPARPEGQRARPGGARDGFGRRPWPGRAPSRLQNSDARLLAARSGGGCGSCSGPPSPGSSLEEPAKLLTGKGPSRLPGRDRRGCCGSLSGPPRTDRPSCTMSMRKGSESVASWSESVASLHHGKGPSRLHRVAPEP